MWNVFRGLSSDSWFCFLFIYYLYVISLSPCYFPILCLWIYQASLFLSWSNPSLASSVWASLLFMVLVNFPCLCSQPVIDEFVFLSHTLIWELYIAQCLCLSLVCRGPRDARGGRVVACACGSLPGQSGFSPVFCGFVRYLEPPFPLPGWSVTCYLGR